MKFEFEKSLRILNELIGYCYKKGGKDIDANILLKPELTRLSVTAQVTSDNEEEYHKLSKTLNRIRQQELEECYWMGNGENVPGEDMNIVSIMVDKADVKYENQILKIVVERFEQQ